MKYDKKAVFAVLKDVSNILLTIAIGAVALMFVLLGLRDVKINKYLAVLVNYYEVFVWVSAAIAFIVLALYVVFYLMKKQSLYRLFFLGVVCAVIFAVIFYILCHTGGIRFVTDQQALQQYIDGFGAWAVIIYILFSYLQVVILPVPGSVTVAAGVMLFGWLECAVYSFIGIVLGSITAFAIGRLIGYKAVCWIVGKEDLDKWLDKIKGKDYLILSLMFLLPMFPDDVLCFVAGLSSMTWPYFLIMITITRLISCFTVAPSINLIPFNEWWGIITWVVILAMVALAFYLVCKYSDRIDSFIKNKLKLGGKKNKDSKNTEKK